MDRKVKVEEYFTLVISQVIEKMRREVANEIPTLISTLPSFNGRTGFVLFNDMNGRLDKYIDMLLNDIKYSINSTIKINKKTSEWLIEKSQVEFVELLESLYQTYYKNAVVNPFPNRQSYLEKQFKYLQSKSNGDLLKGIDRIVAKHILSQPSALNRIIKFWHPEFKKYTLALIVAIILLIFTFISTTDFYKGFMEFIKSFN